MPLKHHLRRATAVLAGTGLALVGVVAQLDASDAPAEAAVPSTVVAGAGQGVRATAGRVAPATRA
ncbi:hypothetical protein, partial [Cellulomonas carbonis]